MTDGTDRLLNANGVAELLNVPVGWVREATRDGRLPCIRLGRYRRYDRADVLAWIEEQKTGGRPTAFRKRIPGPNGKLGRVGARPRPPN